MSGPDTGSAALRRTTRIQAVEGSQAERMRSGSSLRNQLDFARYRREQAVDPTLTLRRYLAENGGAIET